MKFTGERMIPEFNKDQDMYVEHMARYIFASQFVKGKTVLDIACGSGYGSDYLLKAGAKRVIGVDISKETIDYCNERYTDKGIEFHVGSVEKIPLKDGLIDVIISFETIEHVDEKAQGNFIREVKRVLKPDGIFIVSTPNSGVYEEGNPFHVNELSTDEFSRILKNNFSATKMFYQDDIVSSFVFSEKNVAFPKNDRRSFMSKTIGTLVSKDSLFLLTVCGSEDSRLDAYCIDEYLIASDIKPWHKYKSDEKLMKEELSKLDLVIKLKDEEINSRLRKDISGLNQAIKVKDQEIQRKDLEIKSRDENISGLNQAIKVKDQEIQRKEQEMGIMTASVFFKIREACLRLKEWTRLK